MERQLNNGSCRESNPGHLWVELLVLCHWAMTAWQPPALTILYMYCTGGTECFGGWPVVINQESEQAQVSLGLISGNCRLFILLTNLFHMSPFPKRAVLILSVRQFSDQSHPLFPRLSTSSFLSTQVVPFVFNSQWRATSHFFWPWP